MLPSRNERRQFPTIPLLNLLLVKKRRDAQCAAYLPAEQTVLRFWDSGCLFGFRYFKVTKALFQLIVVIHDESSSGNAKVPPLICK